MAAKDAAGFEPETHLFVCLCRPSSSPSLPRQHDAPSVGGATSFDVRGGVTSETTQLCVGLQVSPRSDSKAIQEAI